MKLKCRTGRSGTGLIIGFQCIYTQERFQKSSELVWMPDFSSSYDNDNSEHITCFCTTVLVGTIWLKRYIKLQLVNWYSWMILIKKWEYYYMTKCILEWYLCYFTYYFLSTFFGHIFFASCSNLIPTEQLFCCEQLNICQGWWYMMMD